jgi:hypothetical protein
VLRSDHDSDTDSDSAMRSVDFTASGTSVHWMPRFPVASVGMGPKTMFGAGTTIPPMNGAFRALDPMIK